MTDTQPARPIDTPPGEPADPAWEPVKTAAGVWAARRLAEAEAEAAPRTTATDRAEAASIAACLLGDCAGTPAGIAARLVELAGPIADWIRTGRPPAETQRICAECELGAGATVPLGDPECPHDEAWRADWIGTEAPKTTPPWRTR